MDAAFELGLNMFGDLMPEAQAGKAVDAQQRLADILAAAKLADASGLDVFAVGEHHRRDMAVSATPVVLAAIAAVTERIPLASAVTILSTADPVLVFEDFADRSPYLRWPRRDHPRTRHFLTVPFPLFGYDLADYDDLFAEKLEATHAAQYRRAHHLAGALSRLPLKDAPIPPRPAQSRLPIWVTSGGTQSSIVRAGALGLPLALANISLPPAKLAPLADLYRRTGMQAGHAASTLKVSIATHMHIKQNSHVPENIFNVLADYFFTHTPSQLSRAGGHTGRL